MTTSGDGGAVTALISRVVDQLIEDHRLDTAMIREANGLDLRRQDFERQAAYFRRRRTTRAR